MDHVIIHRNMQATFVDMHNVILDICVTLSTHPSFPGATSLFTL